MCRCSTRRAGCAHALTSARALGAPLAQLTLSDGTIKTFEVSLEEFHKLRYNVARVLKEMRDVEAHPIMRLAFDIEHQEHEE